MSRAQVLACMGPPANRLADGDTEAWSYDSGDGTTIGTAFGSATGSATISGNRVSGSSFGTGFGIGSRRFCRVDVVMQGGAVQRVNYSGPTGGLLTQGDQCAYAVQHCVE